jgi:hypothetical protein
MYMFKIWGFQSGEGIICELHEEWFFEMLDNHHTTQHYIPENHNF